MQPEKSKLYHIQSTMHACQGIFHSGERGWLLKHSRGREYPDLLTYEPLQLQLCPAQHLARLFINKGSVLAPKCSIGWAALVGKVT